ncbi:MAG: hypothetical protein SWH78_16775 [Thermodesulfobacteriota bacterium]|nr:hypothetical protein [Thermodesulfobacteriota bacterium]
MEIPWPKWMEFVVAGISVVLGFIVLTIIDRFQKRRWSQSIGQSEKQNELELGAPLAVDQPQAAFLTDEKGESRPLARASM